jgi:hypothetical protein
VVDEAFAPALMKIGESQPKPEPWRELVEAESSGPQTSEEDGRRGGISPLWPDANLPRYPGRSSTGSEESKRDAGDRAANPKSPAANLSKRKSGWPDPAEVSHLSLEEKLKLIPKPPVQPARQLMKYGIVRDEYGAFQEFGGKPGDPPLSLLSIPWRYLTPQERIDRAQLERQAALIGGFQPRPMEEEIAFYRFGGGEERGRFRGG